MKPVRHTVVALALVGIVAFPPVASRAYPAAGADAFDSTAQVFITPIPGCPSGNAGPLVAGAQVSGPTVIKRSDPSALPDGRMQIPIEMVAMTLSGTSPLGELRITKDPDRAVTGAVTQQQPGIDFPADSFFDVFVEVELGSLPGVTFENIDPIRMESVIHSLPPHAFPYLPPPGTCIPLAIEGTPVPVLWLIHAEHLPRTHRGCFLLSGKVRVREVQTGQEFLGMASGPAQVVHGDLPPGGARIDTELIQLDLRGSVFGRDGMVPVSITDRPGIGSFGALGSGDFPVDSFFDVFADIDIGETSSPLHPMHLGGPYDPQAPTGWSGTTPMPAGGYLVDVQLFRQPAPCGPEFPYPPA